MFLSKEDRIKDKRGKKILIQLLVKFLGFCFVLVVGVFVLPTSGNFTVKINIAQAQGLQSDADAPPGMAVFGGNAVSVNDQGTHQGEEKNFLKQIADYLGLKDLFTTQWWKEHLAATSFKKAIRAFVRHIAHDTAVFLVTGDIGQTPMFRTDNLGTYLKNAADTAVGYFIDSLSQSISRSTGWRNFDLCNPSSPIKMRITVGLYHELGVVPKPRCTFSQMLKNWQSAVQSDNFLTEVQNMFDFRQNDLGIALSLYTEGIEKKQSAIFQATFEDLVNKGFKPVRDKTSDHIKTPGELVAYLAVNAIDKSTIPDTTFTKDIIADFISVFIDTLIATLIEQWFKRGLVTDFPDYSYKWHDIYSYEAQSNSGGLRAAKMRYRKIITAQFNERGDYNILGELTSCPNPNKAGPTNCVINDKFREAIANEMTVGEAMRQGYLNPQGTFGFVAAEGLEPSYLEGYPYRSMIILRKFRIIPVGWEVAAQYIKKNFLSTVRGSKNLAYLVNCFDPNDTYTGEGDGVAWCQGLVDPNWVLKAPRNYCRKEGYGPEILYKRVAGRGKDSSLFIARKGNYCADEQTCIKENPDGACDAYGYCTEERRTWNFKSPKCEPAYNTCQTFRTAQHKRVSYLENTVDHSSCNAGNAGCRAYATQIINYNQKMEKFIWNSQSAKQYLNKKAPTCSEESEGCHEFIRTKAGLGANLLVNASFENNLTQGGWDQFGTQVAGGYDGQFALSLSAGSLATTTHFAPYGYLLGGDSFSLSFYAKNCGQNGEFRLAEATSSLVSGASWQRFSLTYTYPNTTDNNEIDIEISGVDSGCLLDAIKLERGRQPTEFSRYRAQGLVYEKLLPPYLEDVCYNPAYGDYRLRPNAPEICQRFARQCNQEEAGCDLYTSVREKFSVPARLSDNDYCPASCVGYDSFVQTESIFSPRRLSYFIPETAKNCSADAAGCDEFTNLDKVALGGEAKEYYIFLRQCIKPDDPQANCAEFYAWEGTKDTGYQLQVYHLQIDPSSSEPGDTPLDVSGGAEYQGQTCASASDYNPLTNPMCLEFYDTQGNVHYRFLPYTMSCEENCHPYRRTRKDYDPTIVSQADCGLGNLCADAAADGNNACWDNNTGVCLVCKGGGYWSVQHQACLYNAIPGQGKKCSASQAGCREYTGNSGHNIQALLLFDFEEESDISQWQGEGATQVEQSNVSLLAGGHSLYIHNGSRRATTTVNNLIKPQSSYLLTFTARAETDTNVQVLLSNNSSAVLAEAEPLIIQGGEWLVYRAILNTSDLPPAGAYLSIKADNDFYLDNVVFSFVPDRYYLLADSWHDYCDYLNADPASQYVGEQYYVGCDQYRDQDGLLYNLFQFHQLCAEDAVGCEVVIDTHNSVSPQVQVLPDSGSFSGPTVTVPADEYKYIIYDRKKKCHQDDKGCLRFGGPAYKFVNQIIYRDKFLKADPDQYNNILCESQAEDCDEFNFSNGVSYFKEPYGQLCQWRQGQDNKWDWWQVKIKRCDDGAGLGAVNGLIDGGGNPAVPFEPHICLDDSDCATTSITATCRRDSDCGNYEKCVNGVCHFACLEDDNDYACETTYLKTIGYGGLGNRVYQPYVGWAGLCPSSQSGCSEYIDPLSWPAVNLVFNSDFSDIDGDGNSGDGWHLNGSDYEQKIDIEPNTLYVLDVVQGDGAQVSAEDTIYELQPDGQLAAADSVTVAGADSARFYSGNNRQCIVSGGASGKRIELRQAIVNYQFKQKVDKQTCNGSYNFDTGCILFNERSVAGGSNYPISYADLIYDYDATQSANPPAACTGQNCDSNVLIKVAPDRVCNKWLACRSAVAIKNSEGKEENVCFDIGLCDGLDDNGRCDSFVLTRKQEQEVNVFSLSSKGQYANKDGYSKIGLAGITTDSMRGDYPLGEMDQLGNVAMVPNGSFEFYGSNDYPIGWSSKTGSWNDNLFSVINNPVSAQKEGVVYPKEGKSFLKFSSENALYSPLSDIFDVEPDTDYIVSAYINTINLRSINNQAVSAHLYINTFDRSGTPLNSAMAIRVPQGQYWQQYVGRFHTSASAVRAKVYLTGYALGLGDCLSDGSARDVCRGNIYIDDIKVAPALGVRANKIIPQTCRLYPDSDSLACSYFEDSGKFRKGWLGYCLEHDRYPGSENACLLWYPIDRVKGDGIDEGAGYNDRFPLYYCEHVVGGAEKIVDTYMTDHPEDNNPVREGCSGYKSCITYNLKKKERVKRWQISGVNIHMSYSHCGHDHCHGHHGWGDWRYKDPDNIQTSGPLVGEFHYDNDDYLVSVTIKTNGVFCLCPDAQLQIYARKQPCDTIVEVVTPVGRNKYWSSRVYKGSNYVVPLSGFTYLSDYPPFGAIVPPGNTWNIVSNPYEWDSKKAEGIQPLYVELPDYSLSKPYQPRAGQAYSCSLPANHSFYDDCKIPDLYSNVFITNPRHSESEAEEALKRLFAQSYEKWRWQHFYKCKGGTNNGLEGPGNCNQCPGGSCQAVTIQACSSNSLTPGASCSGNCPAGGNCIDCDENTLCSIQGYEGFRCSNNYSIKCCPVNGFGSANCNIITDNRCVGGPNKGAPCSPGSVNMCEVGGGKCVVASKYIPTGELWSPPDTICAGNPPTREMTTHSTTKIGQAGTVTAKCVPSLGAGDGADCAWPVSEIHHDPGGNPNVNYMVYELSTNVSTKLSTLTFSWPSILRCDAYHVYVSPNSSGGWVDIGTVPSPSACPYDHDRHAATYYFNKAASVYDSVRYVKIAKLWDNTNDDSEDTPYDFNTSQMVPLSIISYPIIDYCAIPPEVNNITLNNITDSVFLQKNGYVNLAFNTKVDSQQLPLVMYAVDWGDNEDTVISGVEMRDRQDPSNPHSLYHLYDYWDLRSKWTMDQRIVNKENVVYCGSAGQAAVNFEGNSNGVGCPNDSDCCMVKPKIKIRDNWGWCNPGIDEVSHNYENPTTINDCNQWEEFGGWIVVTEENDQSIELPEPVVTCKNECPSLGSADCNGNIAQICGEYDGDPCLEWGDDIDCSANGQICSGGQCVSGCQESCSGVIDYNSNSYSAAGCYAVGAGPATVGGYIPGGDHCCGNDVCYLCPAGQTWDGSSCQAGNNCPPGNILCGGSCCDSDIHGCYNNECKLKPKINGINVNPDPWYIDDPGSGNVTDVQIVIHIRNIDVNETPRCYWCGVEVLCQDDDNGNCYYNGASAPCTNGTTFSSGVAKATKGYCKAEVKVSYEDDYGYGSTYYECVPGQNRAESVFSYSGQNDLTCYPSDSCPPPGEILDCSNPPLVDCINTNNCSGSYNIVHTHSDCNGQDCTATCYGSWTANTGTDSNGNCLWNSTCDTDWTDVVCN